MQRIIGVGCAVVGLALGVSLAACDRPAGSRAAADCPVCDCADSGSPQPQPQVAGPTPEADPQDPSSGPANPSASNDLSELVAAANRKMMHGDGPGCLADLDRVKALDPKYEVHLVMTRAQCEMLIGQCQAGKARVKQWYEREAAFTPELAARTAESIASMRCRGGDATDRDRLLVALQDLTDGAYMNKRDSAFCRDRVAIIVDLGPKVPPRDVEDTQITGGQQALFYTSAMCFARAGDCKQAYSSFRQFFPSEGLDAIADPKLRESTVRDAFDSTIVLCQPNP
ncbi:hypothetical protein [Enhygromyxa salina]|uniref:Lipoprotein n=1 Tax=Enhygromyxa salina TaxID=215803 RepID=A0A2S9YV04_9BACT|nr:hypothetical protein [Enhygromyxa salina]PRQ08910.1 hypothetical protein ENSA7_13090 [Enhygromyxa salina]